MTAAASEQAQTISIRRRWAEIKASHPVLAHTARRYLTQVSVGSSKNTVNKTDEVLVGFCDFVVNHIQDIRGFSDVNREVIEEYKLHLTTRGTAWGTPLKTNTLRIHLGIVRLFFERIIEWDWDDAPETPPVFHADLPKAPQALPKALDDSTAARFLAAAAADTHNCRQLCIELLARTGMRVGELCDLEADSMSRRSGSWWLRIPLGKLNNDRYVPLHPRLVELIDQWRAHHDNHGTGLLITYKGKRLDRWQIARWVKQVARQAGIGHVHPHQLRHTLATQAINRGMTIEAVAELLGHQNLNMTLRYARIANRTVSDQFEAASSKVDSLYAQSELTEETPAMRDLRLQHRRLLGNGWCTRPIQLDCRFETICEGCGFYKTGPEFLPILRRQRDHAAVHGQADREDIYDNLIADIEEAAPNP